MEPEVIFAINKYGYFAIFILIFLQETGVPNPIPNEFVLFFCGYLISKDSLIFPLVITAAVLGDFIGTNILYIVFYFFGGYLLNHKPKWLPVSVSFIQKMKTRITTRGKKYIYLGRLTPFVRGYTSVACGLVQMPPKTFLPVAILTALTWSTFYVTVGMLTAPYWQEITNRAGWVKSLLIIIFSGIFLGIFITYLLKRREK